jgi:hypothetical protein
LPREGGKNVEVIVPRPVVAITDNPFSSLDPAKKALAKLDPDYRTATSASIDGILAVARDADAILVTYAKPASLGVGSANSITPQGYRRQ